MSPTAQEPKRGYAVCGDCTERISLGDTGESQLAATAAHRRVCKKPNPKSDAGPNNGFYIPEAQREAQRETRKTIDAEGFSP
jgi:hypothetical protein